jgi:GT2 family glycosyltransferase
LNQSEIKSSPRLAVITVTFNAEKFISDFIICCLKQTYCNFELLIIDNLSNDGTLNEVHKFSDQRIAIKKNILNVGYAEACNQGIKYFRQKGHENIIFINNDTEFSSDLFSRLKISSCNYDVAAVVPRITYASNSELNWFAGGKFTFLKGFQGSHLGEGKKHRIRDQNPKLIDVATGCCVLVKMSTFDKIGLFDSNLFVYFEDTDFFLRMKRARLTLLYDPTIIIAHKISQSTGGRQSDFSIRFYQRNQIYLIRKHFNFPVLASQILIIYLKIIYRYIFRLDTFRQCKMRLLSFYEGMKLKL